MTTGWKEYKLGEIVRLNYGKALVAMNREQGNIPVYSSSGVSGWHNLPLVESQGVIVGRKGNVGSVFFSERPFYCIDTAFYVRDNDTECDLKFVYYLLKSLNLIKLSADSAVPGLNRDTAYAQTVQIPLIETQQEIASILSAFDDKIELNWRMYQTLETIAQTLFTEWFIRFNFPSFDGELVDGLPKGWRMGTLGEVIRLNYGKALKADTRGDGTFPVIGSSGIVGYHDNYLVQGPGIVIGRKGTVGEVIWLDENFFPIDTTFYVENLIKTDGLFFAYYLLKQQNFKHIASDSAVPGLNRNEALRNEVIIPCTWQIESFNQLVEPIFDKKRRLKIEIQTLIQLRDSLLPKLMSRQILVGTDA